MSSGLLLALPKGRIARELAPLLSRAGIEPEPAFADDDARQLRFSTSELDLGLIRVRSFDVATFVAFGAAQLGVVGNDVLMEFDYREIYAPLDLRIGLCRMVVAEPAALADGDDPSRWSHVRVATKYPQVTQRHFAARGVQAECIKLSGAMEPGARTRALPPHRRPGRHRRHAAANGLVEVEHIADVSSRLVVNRTALKTRAGELRAWIERFREAADGTQAG